MEDEGLGPDLPAELTTPDSPLAIRGKKKAGYCPAHRSQATRTRNAAAVEKSAQWTLFSSAQSLSSALNDPVNRELDLFTKTWGSYFIPTAPVQHADLPSISLGDFMCYLRETRAGRKLHRALVRQISKEETRDTFKCSSNIKDFLPLRSQLEQEGENFNMAAVPRVFLLPEFTLEDPLIFQEVLPLADVMSKKSAAATEPAQSRTVGHSGARADAASCGGSSGTVLRANTAEEVGVSDRGSQEDKPRSMKLLHEKLAHYLDVVEVHLAYHISQRSDVFFSTLTSQQELESFIMKVRQDVMDLRHKLRSLDTASTHRTLHLFSKCRSRERLRVVHEKAQLVAVVQQTQPTIQLLLRNSDFVAALDLITTTQEVLQQELHGVHALR